MQIIKQIIIMMQILTIITNILIIGILMLMTTTLHMSYTYDVRGLDAEGHLPVVVDGLVLLPALARRLVYYTIL